MSSSGRVRKQHVVSVVLLKRFTRKEKVLVEDVRRPGRPPRLESPRAVGYIEDYVRVDSASVEAVWHAVETRLHASFADVDARQVVAAGSSTEATIKDCLALHWARSKAVRTVAERAFATVRQDSWDHWATHPALDEIFRAEHGLAAAGPQARAMVNDRLHSGPPEIVSGQHFADRVVGFFDAAYTSPPPAPLPVLADRRHGPHRGSPTTPPRCPGSATAWTGHPSRSWAPPHERSRP